MLAFTKFCECVSNTSSNSMLGGGGGGSDYVIPIEETEEETCPSATNSWGTFSQLTQLAGV